jgi:hypothetical protein
MKSCRRAAVIMLSIAVSAMHAAALARPALAEDCAGGFLRSSIAGEGSRVKLSLGGQVAACGQDQVKDIGLEPQPYFTHEIACSNDRQAASEGLCSTTPCPDIRRFFAFRTIHFPDGTVQPAGFQCVSLAEAAARPGVTVGQVFEAVRRVRLPGGEIGVEPGVRGLANLESFFLVDGANHPPVELQVG